jgi:hypothetical protein
MRKAFGLWAVFIGVVTACGNSSSSSNGGSACCLSTQDDAGVSLCSCQPVGTVSQGGFTGTLAVSGTSCTMSQTFSGSTTTSMGSVVTSCGD